MVSELLEAILKLFPLDSYVDYPVALMQVVPGDPYKPAVWDTYKEIIQKSPNKKNSIEYIERFAFYERAKNAYAVVATSETALYANIILKKGVVIE